MRHGAEYVGIGLAAIGIRHTTANVELMNGIASKVIFSLNQF